MAKQNLDSLRESIGQLDLEILARVAERVALARQAGELKRRQKLPTVNYAQERTVMVRARAVAEEHGLDPEVAEDLRSGV